MQKRKIGYSNISADPVSAIAGAVGALANLGQLANKTGLQGDVKAACGNKPLTNIGGKLDAYKACSANYVQAQIQLRAQENQLASAQLAAQNNKPAYGTGAIIGISLGVLALTGTIVILILKR